MTRFELGTWNAICAQCAGTFKAYELKKHWQGQWWCDRCFETRHPQDFVKATADVQTPPWTQPAPADDFVPMCTPNGITAIVGFARVGCARVGYRSPMFDPSITE